MIKEFKKESEVLIIFSHKVSAAQKKRGKAVTSDAKLPPRKASGTSPGPASLFKHLVTTIRAHVLLSPSAE